LSGFNKPTPVPSSIVNFLELEDGASLPRTQITKRMYAYIKLNKLQDPQDKRTIMPDAKLKALFHLDDSEKVTFYNIQSHIKKLYPHVVKADSATESSASAVPVAVEASASALPSLAASSEAVSEEPKKGGGGGVKKKKPNVSTWKLNVFNKKWIINWFNLWFINEKYMTYTLIQFIIHIMII